jgi:hypothetical protein
VHARGDDTGERACRFLELRRRGGGGAALAEILSGLILPPSPPPPFCECVVWRASRTLCTSIRLPSKRACGGDRAWCGNSRVCMHGGGAAPVRGVPWEWVCSWGGCGERAGLEPTTPLPFGFVQGAWRLLLSLPSEARTAAARGVLRLTYVRWCFFGSVAVSGEGWCGVVVPIGLQPTHTHISALAIRCYCHPGFRLHLTPHHPLCSTPYCSL